MFAVQTTSESTGCVLLLPPFEKRKAKWHERGAEIKIEHDLEYVFVLLRSSLVKMKSLLGFCWDRKRSWVVACGAEDWWKEVDLATPWGNAHLYPFMWWSLPFLHGPHTSGYKNLSFLLHYLLLLIAHLGVLHCSKPSNRTACLCLCRSFQNPQEQTRCPLSPSSALEEAW